LTSKKKSGAQQAQSHKEIEVKLHIADKAAFLKRLARLGAEPAGPRVHEMNTLFDTPEGALARGGKMARIRVERAASRPVDSKVKGKRGKSGDENANAKAGSTATLTYKGPPEGATGPGSEGPYKVREEHEVRIGNAQVLEGLCRLLGLQPWFRYEKYRSPYVLPGIKGVVLDFDETPVGDYLELEGDRAAIDRSARLLGFTKADYIVKSYGGLFMESLRDKRHAHAKGRRTGRTESSFGRGAASQNEPTPESRLPDMLFSKQKSRRK
jgi:adenylate cyclase class IV